MTNPMTRRNGQKRKGCPAAFACYRADGDLRRLKGDRAYLNLLIDENIEGFRAIEKGGHEILPKSDRSYESISYRRICYAFFKLMCATPLGKICASDHAMNAVDEMSALNRELKAYFEKVGAPYKKSRTGRAFLRFMCGSLGRGENLSCPDAFPVLAGFPPSKRP